MNVLILFILYFLFLNSQSFCVCVCVFAFFFFLPIAWGQALSRCVKYKKFSLMLTSHLFFLLFSLAQSCLQNLPYSRDILNLFSQSKDVCVFTKHQTFFWMLNIWRTNWTALLDVPFWWGRWIKTTSKFVTH